jgi:ABC-type transport system substrate-binding protein
MDFRAMLDRVFQTHEYEAAIMTLSSGDTDPSSQMNVLVTKGNTRLWDLDGAGSSPWEREIDRLMRAQMVALDFPARKRYYDRVQEIFAENLPFICLVSAHVLVGAADQIGNFKPSILRPYALWNADQLYLRPQPGANR